MPTKLNKILKYNHGEKSLETVFVIYADLENLLIKNDLVKIILMNLILKEKLCMNLRGTY